MKEKAVSGIALRLLQIEQRFESYCTLHEEELREIKATLAQLREDILALHRSLDAADDNPGPMVIPEIESSEHEQEEASALAL